ncbi:K02A2.6-like [Cordylochernes scorpioides]|uniref:RNA-directed DNA polymerase n=1 Tax=Cordylochernes scorpioides TaxID=51811 RepID=A0ABY6KID5_9ARAC|nr:K02A2.6-like [Cordylochernes scorpioides]
MENPNVALAHFAPHVYICEKQGIASPNMKCTSEQELWVVLCDRFKDPGQTPETKTLRPSFRFIKSHYEEGRGSSEDDVKINLPKYSEAVKPTTFWKYSSEVLIGITLWRREPRDSTGFEPVQEDPNPRTCQDQMLKLLHQGHIGINRMKSLARSSVWWPKMDSQIEEFVKECSPCMHHQTAPPAENTPWPRTNQPWQRVHVDHFYFRGDCYLLVVDANSNWIEVFPVRGTTSQENIKLLRECFARYGLPQCLVSDNGPPFNSLEFKEFLRKNNVYHLTSPAYNPSSNGIAEVSKPLHFDPIKPNSSLYLAYGINEE